MRKLYIALLLALLSAILAGSYIGVKLLRGPGEPQLEGVLQVVTPKTPVEPMRVDSTMGVITVPLPGKVNVFVPQYVRCPYECHMETAIMVFLFEKVLEKRLEDKVAFITISVDPWRETLEEALAYQRGRAGDYMDKGVYWAWIVEDVETQKKLWRMYGIGAARVGGGSTGHDLVMHFLGFIIVVDGEIRYVAPLVKDALTKHKDVADQLWSIIEYEARALS